MDSERDDNTEAGEKPDITRSPSPTHEATTPPGQGDRDEEAIKDSEEGLDKAGGGH